jgi:hypothetical protein
MASAQREPLLNAHKDQLRIFQRTCKMNLYMFTLFVFTAHGTISRFFSMLLKPELVLLIFINIHASQLVLLTFINIPLTRLSDL